MSRPSKRTTLVAGAVLAAAVAALAAPHLISSHGLSAAELKQAEEARVATGTLEQRFALLSQRHTNKCSLASTDLNAIAVRGRVQGSCCSPMVFDRYVQQVRGLRAYAALSEVPADAYDIPVGLAKRLLGFDRALTLSPAQLAIYDRAVKLSDEHGPCCCHCWRWTAFEGQGKELILRRHYSAAQIARIWDLEDGCGGS